MTLHRNFSIIRPMQLYPISENIAIVSSTPFLFIKNTKTLIVGDIHFGQESSLFKIDTQSISKTTVEMTELLLKTINQHDIKTVICNGDVKHHTETIKIQELTELKYFSNQLLSREINLEFIRGNHDLMLEYLLPHVSEQNFKLIDTKLIENIFIHHGDQNYDNQKAEVIVLSHEHPAFTFRGMNKAKVKVPAFVLVKAKNKQVIILPAANSISSGVNFPITSKNQFISPFLRQFADLSTLEIIPFDRDIGIMELPSVNIWSKV